MTTSTELSKVTPVTLVWDPGHGNCKAEALAKAGATLDTTAFIRDVDITLANYKRSLEDLHAVADKLCEK